MADPLKLLRQFNIEKKEIQETDDQISFGEITWPKNTKTNYFSWGSGRDGKPKDYYTLESLLFLLRQSHLRHPLYAQKAKEKSIPLIRRPDRKHLLAYLNGERETTASISRNVVVEAQKQSKRLSDETEDEITKRPKLD